MNLKLVPLDTSAVPESLKTTVLERKPNLIPAECVQDALQER